MVPLWIQLESVPANVANLTLQVRFEENMGYTAGRAAFARSITPARKPSKSTQEQEEFP